MEAFRQFPQSFRSFAKFVALRRYCPDNLRHIDTGLHFKIGAMFLIVLIGRLRPPNSTVSAFELVIP